MENNQLLKGFLVIIVIITLWIALANSSHRDTYNATGISIICGSALIALAILGRKENKE